MSRGAQTAVVLSPGGGHVQRLLPLVAGLAERGLRVHVMTRPEARAAVGAAGGAFFDLFGKFPLEAADAESIPLPSRFVSFAAVYADALCAEVEALRPRLLVYDSFVVAAPLVARRLGIPYVGMRAGHAQVPARAIAEIERDPRVRTSDACRAAVERLRREHDMPEAGPFAYLDGMSPHLNLCAEPPQFLDADERRHFEPVAFFGSLAPDLREAASRGAGERAFAGAGAAASRGGRLRVYVSFGSVIWRYYTQPALAALEQLADAFAGLVGREAELLVSLGNHPADAGTRRRIERPGVRVASWVDQWRALAEADLFVTHHGLNSTHEAIYQRVPMLSYPFFGDQPEMARRCQRLGLAAALADAPRAEIDPARARRALEDLLARREAFAARLDEARGWELAVIAGREAVLDRVLALAGL
jgi:UDP:flavonoid glycosyltransferase YjiC (YdhE family)